MLSSRMSRKNWFQPNREISRTFHHRPLRFENLEQRLALTWVGVPPTSITPPTTAVTATLNSSADATGAASIATTEIDYYSFTATRTGSYTISATTPSSSVDTVLGIFSATGQRLAYNDDIVYGTNTDSRLTISLTAGTRYVIGITNYSSSSRGAYTWTIDGPAGTTTTVPTTDDTYENNDSLSAANNLGTLSAARTVGSLVMADAQDWYRFTTTATATSANNVSISFQNSQGDLQLALYNSAGTLLATSQGTSNSELLSLNGRAAGTYYVLIYGNNGVTNTNYSLTINPPAATTPSPTTPTTTGGFEITLSMSGLTASQQAIFQQAADRWEQVITGDLPNATYRGQTVDDLLISASSVSIDGVNGILGQAGPDAFRSASRLPYHGIMQFDSADMASMEQRGLLLSVVMHEMGHVLGVGTIWGNLGLLTGAGTSNPIFTGAQATAAYNALFGTSAAGVPVENTGGAGTRDGHWRETIFVSEIMTGWAGPGTNLPISRVTVASMADLGYTVNMAAADSYTPSSSALTAARSATRSTAAALTAFDSSTAQWSFVDASSSPRLTNTTPRSLPAHRFAAAQFDPSLIDRVMANSSQDDTDAQASCSDYPETPDEFAFDWDLFDLDWAVTSALALTYV